MAQIEHHPDFKDFLRLLSSHGIKYLVVGGYAVGYYGYPRATADMDIWIAVDEVNAEKTAQTLRDFGMPEKESIKDLFIEQDKIIRMGVPPIRIEIITGASGIEFEECYLRREVIDIDNIPVNFISLEDLKTNVFQVPVKKRLNTLCSDRSSELAPMGISDSGRKTKCLRSHSVNAASPRSPRNIGVPPPR